MRWCFIAAIGHCFPDAAFSHGAAHRRFDVVSWCAAVPLSDHQRRKAEMIEIKDIAFSYPDGDILKGVGFAAESGEVVGLLGNNGAGKSTLVTCLNRIRKPKRSYSA